MGHAGGGPGPRDAVKAVIAAHGHPYARTHNLPDLLQEARTCVPDLALHSDLAKLSRFAGGDACGNSDLDIDPKQMLINAKWCGTVVRCLFPQGWLRALDM